MSRDRKCPIIYHIKQVEATTGAVIIKADPFSMSSVKDRLVYGIFACTGKLGWIVHAFFGG